MLFKTLFAVAALAASAFGQAAIPYPSGCQACNVLGQALISTCRTNASSVDDNTIVSIASCICPILLQSGSDCRTCITASTAHQNTNATQFFVQLSDSCAEGATDNNFLAAANNINPIIRQVAPATTSSSATITTTTSAAATTAGTTSAPATNANINNAAPPPIQAGTGRSSPSSNFAVGNEPHAVLSLLIAGAVAVFAL
ncbi:hypothetical protein HDU96_009270 [Phlyctochytrium bullatum]|nr:hypothetical protein HDU96_009270 [Phlyctochytrium bullatum]